MLQLQQYEWLLKATLQLCQMTVKPNGDKGGLVVQQADVTRKTLGMLVGAFTGGHLVGLDETEPDEWPIEDDASVSFQIRIRLTDEDLAQTTQDLGELVTLRNGLVHHFIEQHDIATAAGCQSALDALQAADNLIDTHLVRLQEWATTLAQARQEAARVLASGPVIEMIVRDIDDADASRRH